MAQNSNNGSDSPKSISKVVGQHADRVMDGLFSEIEDLLSGDLQEKQTPMLNAATKAPHNLEPSRPPVPQALPEQSAPANRPLVSLPPTPQSSQHQRPDLGRTGWRSGVDFPSAWVAACGGCKAKGSSIWQP